MSATFTALVTATGTVGQITVTSGEYPVYAIANNPILPGNGSVVVPNGTTGQRILGLGAIRLNTTTGFFECSSDNATWQNLAVGGGGIASVSGTAGEIDVTGGANPVISIDPAYVGQTSITTLGTITTGTWNGTTIDVVYGGTGLNATTANQLLYSSANNVIAGLSTANSAVLVTTSAGVPVFSGTMTNGQIIIGSTGATPVAASLTAGAGVTITPGAGSITISATGSGGTVTSVSGTLNRITSTGGTTPVIDIDAAYVGQTSITTLGTVITGAWNASIIPLAYGGSNANLTASNGGIVWSNATQMQILAGTATAGQMLQSGATATPAWSTSTWPATTTINQLLYSSSANVVAGLATANNSILATSAGGVPAFTTSLPTAVQVGVNSLNSGTSASATTYWSGNGTWTTPGSSAGSLVFLTSATGSGGATIEFDNIFTATYTSYLFVFNAVVPSTGAFFTCQLGYGAGPTFQTSGYAWNASQGAGGGSASSSAANINLSGSSVAVNTTAAVGFSGQMFVTNVSGNSAEPVISGAFSYSANTVLIANSNIAGLQTSAQIYNSIRFSFSSGNIATGTIRVYGVI